MTTRLPNPAHLFRDPRPLFGWNGDALRSAVMATVRVAVQELKVLWSVVCLDAVAVVNMLFGSEMTPKRGLHDQAMFEDVTPVGMGMARTSDDNVAETVDVASLAAPHAPAVVIADEPLRDPPKHAVADIGRCSDGRGLAAPTLTQARSISRSWVASHPQLSLTAGVGVPTWHGR